MATPQIASESEKKHPFGQQFSIWFSRKGKKPPPSQPSPKSKSGIWRKGPKSDPSSKYPGFGYLGEVGRGSKHKQKDDNFVEKRAWLPVLAFLVGANFHIENCCLSGDAQAF